MVEKAARGSRDFHEDEAVWEILDKNEHLQKGYLKHLSEKQHQERLEKALEEIEKYRETNYQLDIELCSIKDENVELNSKLEIATTRVKDLTKEVKRLNELTSPTQGRKKPRSPTSELKNK